MMIVDVDDAVSVTVFTVIVIAAGVVVVERWRLVLVFGVKTKYRIRK